MQKDSSESINASDLMVLIKDLRSDVQETKEIQFNLLEMTNLMRRSLHIHPKELDEFHRLFNKKRAFQKSRYAEDTVSTVNGSSEDNELEFNLGKV